MEAAVTEDLGIDSAKLRKVCTDFGVRWFAVFGSVARGEAKPDSDVDLLYELKPGQVMGYFGLERLAEALGDVFGGRYVDIARPVQLHWYIRDEVLAEARVLYEE